MSFHGFASKYIVCIHPYYNYKRLRMFLYKVVVRTYKPKISVRRNAFKGMVRNFCAVLLVSSISLPFSPQSTLLFPTRILFSRKKNLDLFSHVIFRCKFVVKKGRKEDGKRGETCCSKISLNASCSNKIHKSQMIIPLNMAN